ncbi:MAG: alginate lyase, partial [Caulobacter sp.]
IDAGFPLKQNLAERPVLGKDDGYQHLWVDATGAPDATNARLTWINGERFYTWRMLPPAGAEVILGESGANDPKFNLRREPVLIQRVKSPGDTTFVGVLEPHGAYDPSAETTEGSTSRIEALRHVRTGDADVVTIVLAGGRKIILAVADSAEAGAAHKAVVDGAPLSWKGHFARFDAKDVAQ